MSSVTQLREYREHARCGLDGELSALGIDPDEERAYLLLLECPGPTVAEMAHKLNLELAEVRKLVGAMAEDGLITIAFGPRTTFDPVPPGVAFDALVARQHEKLQQAWLAVAELTDRARRAAVRRGVAEQLEQSWALARASCC